MKTVRFLRGEWESAQREARRLADARDARHAELMAEEAAALANGESLVLGGDPEGENNQVGAAVPEVRELPGDLAALDRLLADPELLAPIVHPLIGVDVRRRLPPLFHRSHRRRTSGLTSRCCSPR